MQYVVLVLMLGATPTQTQPQYTQYGQHTERGGTRVAFWDNVKNEAAGQVAIDFGRPIWKVEYEEQLDAMTSGKIWRLGENFWTSLDANLPLEIGGVAVAPGYYYLVVRRSADGGEWRLGFVNPVQTRSKRLDPFEVGTRPDDLPVVFDAPLAFEKKESVEERLAIELSEEELLIRWGSFGLSAPVKVAPR